MKISAASIFLLFVAKVRAWVDYSLVFTDAVVAEVNETVFANTSTWLTKYNRTTTVVNMSTMLLRDIYSDIEIEFHGTEIIRNRPRDTPILDVRLDLCKYLKTQNKTGGSILIDIFYKSFVKYGNFPKSCPFHKGEIYVKDLVIDDDLLPGFMPGEKWKFTVTFYLSNLTMARGIFTMAVDRTTKLRESLIRKMG